MKKRKEVILMIILISIISLSFYSASTTITDSQINTTGNLTLGQKITFAFGETIDNIVDGIIKITATLNMNNHDITNVQTLDFNESYSYTGSEDIGSFYYNDVAGVYNIKMDDDVTFTIDGGNFYAKATEDISNGDIIMYAGVQGAHPLIKKANITELEVLPHLLLGVATEDILTNEFGYTTHIGYVSDIYTYDWSEGDILYFDWSGGNLTNVRPSKPNRVISFAVVIMEQTGAAQNGVIFVRPRIGANLEDISDINNTCAIEGILVKNVTSEIWECTNDLTINNLTVSLYKSEGKIGINASGTSCTITEITNGIITNATCT